MRRYLIALALILSTACSESVVEPSGQLAEEQTLPTFARGAAGPAAYGNAGIDFLGRVQTTAFAANGATGEMEVAIFGTDPDLVGHFKIDCLNVDGNTATMSGNITIPHEFAGFVPFVFRVEDNRKGGGVDQVSLISFAFQPIGVDCNSAEAAFDPPLSLFPIDRGNVTVIE